MRTRNIALIMFVMLVVVLPFSLGHSAAGNYQIAQRSLVTPVKPAIPQNFTDETDTTLLFETFETGAAGWTFTDLSVQPPLWHVDDYNHYSGGGSTLSWWSGDTTIMGYNDHTLVYLDSPTLNLTGAVNPTLTFNLFHSVETTPGATPPYDGWDACNVWISTNNGASWRVIPNPTPAYNMTSSYAFGFEFGMGPGIPGWGGYSGGVSPGAWVNASFSLNAYIGSQVKIRFAMRSDPAYSTPNDPTLRGMFVDNVLIQAGANLYLQNNAEGLAVPSELEPIPSGTPVGNFWHVEDVTSPPFPGPIPSPSHIARMSDGNGISSHYPPLTYCALVSPFIDLTSIAPGTGDIWADFMHTGQINISDPDSFPNLDIWTIEVKPDTAPVWYNWNDPFNQGAQHFVFSTLGATWDSLAVWQGLTNGVDLHLYAGCRIQVRVLFQADPDQFSGFGMLVDNFKITYNAGLAHDVSARNMLVPMPTSTYFDSLNCSVRIYNLGLNNEGQVPAFWRVNGGVNNPLFPWAIVNIGQFVTKTFKWETPSPGNYFFDAFTNLGTDMDHSNDTAKAGLVELTPDSIFEFGYDNRQYSYETVYYFNFDPNEGAYIRYTPVADGVNATLYGRYLRAMFQETGSIRIHIYQAGTPTTPGPEVTSWVANVTSPAPNWQQFPIDQIAYLQGTNTDFWVYYERVDATSAHILGDDIINGAGHFFDNFSGSMTASVYDFFARAVFGTSPLAVEGEEESMLPSTFNLYQNNPNPFNPATVIRYDLPVSAQVNLSVFDLNGRLITNLVNTRQLAGRHEAAFDGSGLALGIYLYRINAGEFSSTGKMVLLK